MGNNHLSAIGTLVERQTRLVRLVHLPHSDADSLHAASPSHPNRFRLAMTSEANLKAASPL
jgi:IS30 family transposase